jgi:hypothetical protein
MDAVYSINNGHKPRRAPPTEALIEMSATEVNLD